MEDLGKFSYGLIVMTIGSIVNAFVIQKLWTWILIPVLGLNPITIGSAFGISVVVSFFREKKPNDKKEYGVKELTILLGWVLGNAIFYLLIGWIASFFV